MNSRINQIEVLNQGKTTDLEGIKNLIIAIFGICSEKSLRRSSIRKMQLTEYWFTLDFVNSCVF